MTDFVYVCIIIVVVINVCEYSIKLKKYIKDKREKKYN